MTENMDTTTATIHIDGDAIRLALPTGYSTGDRVPFEWLDTTAAIATLEEVTGQHDGLDLWRFNEHTFTFEPTTQEEPTMETPTEPTRRYRLLARFYDDHVSRDLPGGVEISRRKNEVLVELTAAEYDEMLSDARYYSDRSMFEWEQQYICSSAEGTVRRLEKTGPPA